MRNEEQVSEARSIQLGMGGTGTKQSLPQALTSIRAPQMAEAGEATTMSSLFVLASYKG